METSELMKTTHIFSHRDSYFVVYSVESLGRLWCRQNTNAAKTQLYFCGAVSVDYLRSEWADLFNHLMPSGEGRIISATKVLGFSNRAGGDHRLSCLPTRYICTSCQLWWQITRGKITLQRSSVGMGINFGSLIKNMGIKVKEIVWFSSVPWIL